VSHDTLPPPPPMKSCWLLDRRSLPLLRHLSDISTICNFWPQLQILGGQLTAWHLLIWPSRAPVCVRRVCYEQSLSSIFTSAGHIAPPVHNIGHYVSSTHAFLGAARLCRTVGPVLADGFPNTTQVTASATRSQQHLRIKSKKQPAFLPLY